MATPDPTFSGHPSTPMHPVSPVCPPTKSPPTKSPMYPVHFSQTLSVKVCQCGDHLRRWRVRKESPNRGRVFLQCQTAWPVDLSGRTISCPAWYWEDELDPPPDTFSFEEAHRGHPASSAYFQSLNFLKRNSQRARDLIGMKVKMKTAEVGVQTEFLSMECLRLEDSNDFSLRYSPESQRYLTPCLSPRSHSSGIEEHSEQTILFPGEAREES